MIVKRAACLALLLVLATLIIPSVNANARRVEQKPIGTLPWTLRHVETVYRWQDDTTTFVYRLDSGSRDLSQFIISTSADCANGMSHTN